MNLTFRQPEIAACLKGALGDIGSEIISLIHIYIVVKFGYIYEA